MPVNVERFKTNTRPVNLLQLMDENVLVNLLNGFCYALKAGVAVLFASKHPVTMETLIRRDALGDVASARSFFNPICRKFRESCTENEKKCQARDKEIAYDYYRGLLKGPQIYRCPLHLWDMTYPLHIGGQLLGVLFAGQIIVTEKVPSWKDALAGHDSHVKWDSFNANHQDQTQDIFGAIEHTVEDPTKPTLYDLLKETPKLPLKDFESRIQDFFQFGKMMTSLLARSYRLTVLAEQQRLLHGLAVELVKKTSHPNHWWINLANLLGQMYEATDAYPVDIYSREQSDYVLKIEGREVVNTHEARHVPVRTCIDFPTDELAKISELDSPADVAALFQAVPSAYIFKCDLAGVDAGDTSTIIVLHRTEVVGHWKDFATAFCEVVGLRSDISANLQQIVQDRESFGKRVRNVSHSAKTPLQRALARLNSARVMRRGDDVFRELTPGVLKLLQQDILDAKAELAELYAGMARPRTRANLRSLLSRLENEMRPLAIAKDCTIDLRLPDEEMWVNMCEAEIRIALRNLLDNAIKYSFGGHDIRMVARVVQNKTVEILFHNFGLGIPENLIQAIRYEGQRAKVVDRAKGTRSGMGLGLPIAIGFLEPHGGSFDINSRASDPHPREAYHRWITEAIVTLPLMGAMQANE